MNTVGFVLVVAGAFVGVEALKQFSAPATASTAVGTGTVVAPSPSPGIITSDRTPVAVGNVSGLLSQAGADLADIPAYLALLGHENTTADPTVVNPTGVQTAAGIEHATGLWQMLPSTFMENAAPGHTDITNPLDNTLAMLNYVRARYGSVQNIPNLYYGTYVGY